MGVPDKSFAHRPELWFVQIVVFVVLRTRYQGEQVARNFKPVGLSVCLHKIRAARNDEGYNEQNCQPRARWDLSGSALVTIDTGSSALRAALLGEVLLNRPAIDTRQSGVERERR